jgi:hypothetical protein
LDSADLTIPRTDFADMTATGFSGATERQADVP